MNRIGDWRIWAGIAAACLSLASLITVAYFVTSAGHVSTQQLCIANLQGDFDKHIAQLVVGSIDKNQAQVEQAKADLSIDIDEFERIKELCP